MKQILKDHQSHWLRPYAILYILLQDKYEHLVVVLHPVTALHVRTYVAMYKFCKTQQMLRCCQTWLQIVYHNGAKEIKYWTLITVLKQIF
jgi:hypothetical protein